MNFIFSLLALIKINIFLFLARLCPMVAIWMMWKINYFAEENHPNQLRSYGVEQRLWYVNTMILRQKKRKKTPSDLAIFNYSIELMNKGHAICGLIQIWLFCISYGYHFHFHSHSHRLVVVMVTISQIFWCLNGSITMSAQKKNFIAAVWISFIFVITRHHKFSSQYWQCTEMKKFKRKRSCEREKKYNHYCLIQTTHSVAKESFVFVSNSCPSSKEIAQNL